ncbi:MULTISPECIES: REP-associated tyrosine transposase [unclassified Halomonas]|uniref:REP-associated tyrosine transposase n=1 Tax=unclassified Halomonas TaxID=2609666 RepID=UPI0028851447|nr:MULTISPECIES: transposase [unclassified Halomonas]MDT0502514.1 transposase [Halomonas sp. PAR7]MDT0510281.1 transposase [Halomonas sp. LES1]MDT0590010.1 transposase [Halomonas sp. PAR8]
MDKPHGHSLRKGRVSLPGHYYLVTIVTRHRQPWFHTYGHAAIASRNLYHHTVLASAETLSFVVMPDHIHWLLELHTNLSEAVRKYKSRVSWEVGIPIWQRGFHDHALRKEEDLRRVARYIVANPLRAGLVDNIGDYPYWNAIWL